MNTASLKDALCKHFCADILVKECGAGVVVSSGMALDGGDRISFMIVDVGDSYYLADDGDFLSSLDASGMDFAADGRRNFLEGTLGEAGAYWDSDTFVIRTNVREGTPSPGELISFLVSLVRVRDVRFWTKEAVRSTFKDDVTAAIRARFSDVANISVGKPVDDAFPEYPVDVVLRPAQGGISTAVYLVNSNDGLNEALMLWQEARSLKRDDVKVVAIIEDEDSAHLNRKKKQRTINRIDAFAYYRGDEKAVIERLGRVAELSATG